MSSGVQITVVDAPAVEVSPVDDAQVAVQTTDTPVSVSIGEDVVSVHLAAPVIQVIDLPYAHPVGDGNQHVPPTGTGNDRAALMAGATPGSSHWRLVDWTDLDRNPHSYRVIAGEALGGHRIVVTDDAGRAIHADPGNRSHANRVLGMTTGAAAEGAPVHLVRAFQIEEPTWSWIMEAPVFVGPAGVLTQAVPASPAAVFALIVGMPLTATRLYINVRDPIFL